MTLLAGKSRIKPKKTIEAVSCVAAASSLLFDFVHQSGVGSSGIAFVGYRFRLSYARWRNRRADSNSELHCRKSCSVMQD
jgi:hypothetical protein